MTVHSADVSGISLFPSISGVVAKVGRREKDPHPQDKSQHLDFTKDTRPL